MNDEDIAKLAAKLTVTLATKEDIEKLDKKIDKLNQKADTILNFAEEVDNSVFDHEERLKRIESIPMVAHELKTNSH